MMTPAHSQTPRRRAFLVALKAVGGLSWTLAYRRAIQSTRKTDSRLLPPIAMAFNFAWEAIYSAGGVAKWRDLEWEDRAQTAINLGWLYNDARWVHEVHVRDGQPLPVRMVLVGSAYQALFLSLLPAGDAARVSALWQNLAFSAYCAVAQPLPARDDPDALAFTAYRAVGTAIPTATSGVLRGVRPRYLIPGLGCVGFDLIRLLRQLQHERRQDLDRNPHP